MMFSNDGPMFSSGDGSPLMLACASGNYQAVLSLVSRQNINMVFFSFLYRISFQIYLMTFDIFYLFHFKSN